MPYRKGRRSTSPLLRALDVVGSDVENFECPRCGAHDRLRHLILYLRASGLMSGIGGARVLHFAPEPGLVDLLSALGPSRYVLADLIPGLPGVEAIDIQSIPYADAEFDFVIANHVLEHVEDDLLALREIRRVLRPGGAAILQTPYCARLTSTWSDGGIDSGPARWVAYGQEDHVRLYGRDIFDRFASVGLDNAVSDHASLLTDVDPAVVGVNTLEPFFLFRRPVPAPAQPSASFSP